MLAIILLKNLKNNLKLFIFTLLHFIFFYNYNCCRYITSYITYGRLICEYFIL